MRREESVANRLRIEYDECTRALENPLRSIRSKCQRLERVLWIFSEWYANDLHTEHADDVGALTTERGIAAFNAALADVLPALQLASAVLASTTEEKEKE